MGEAILSDAPAAAEVGSGEKPASTRKLAVHGAAWSLGTTAACQVLRLGSNVVLAKLLYPEAFGISALATAFARGLQMFMDVGIGTSIIQNPRGEETRYVNTAWTMQVVRGVALCMGLAMLAWPVARMYGQPQLLGLVLMLGLTAVMDGFSSTAAFSLSRKLAISKASMVTLGENIVSIAAMLLFAWVYRSIWAFAAGWVAGVGFRMVATHLINPGERNRFCWDAEAARSLFHFGKWIFISTAITFLANQLDRLLLGRLVPMGQLGVYGFAISLVYVPHMIAGKLGEAVLYPVLAREARDNRADLGRKLLRARGAILPAALALMIGTVLIAPLFFAWLYDRRYQDAGWMAQLLGLYMWFMVLQVLADRALLAIGDTRPMVVSNAANVITTAIGCCVGYWLGGMAGFIAGLCLSSLAGHIVIQIALMRQGIWIVWQDGFFTLIGLLAGGIGALAPKFCGGLVEAKMRGVVSAAIVAPIVLGMGLWAAWTAKGVVKS